MEKEKIVIPNIKRINFLIDGKPVEVEVEKVNIKETNIFRDDFITLEEALFLTYKYKGDGKEHTLEITFETEEKLEYDFSPGERQETILLEKNNFSVMGGLEAYFGVPEGGYLFDGTFIYTKNRYGFEIDIFKELEEWDFVFIVAWGYDVTSTELWYICDPVVYKSVEKKRKLQKTISIAKEYLKDDKLIIKSFFNMPDKYVFTYDCDGKPIFDNAMISVDKETGKPGTYIISENLKELEKFQEIKLTEN